YSQIQFSGSWEGVFMNDFNTKIEFNSEENNNYTGRIQMFSGGKVIQDDPISKINSTQHLLTFRIESKETDFKGKFNNDITELSGVFVFPDKSEHPLKLVRSTVPESSEEDSAESYWDLRNKKYPVDELTEDLMYLVDQLKEIHPALYSYSTQDKFNSLVNESIQNISSELTIIEFFNLIAPIVENIRCSHTGIRLPEDFQKEIYSNDNFLPLKLIIEGNKAFCLENYENLNPSILPGNEIISINNIPIQTIIQKLYAFIPSEGNNSSTKNYQANQNFNTYYNLLDNSPRFDIEYVNSNSKMKTSLKAYKYPELGLDNNVIQDDLPIEFYTDYENKIGFLTVRSFMIRDINQYIQKMDSIFSSLKNEMTEHIVIDLRGNSGGHPIFAAQLFSYLTDKDFTYFKRNMDAMEFEPLYNTMHPNKLQFEGDIYVLTDGGCLSTTGHLISLIKHHTNAKFIGTEPGSTYCCNDLSKKITLPNTGIEANIPRTTFETATDHLGTMEFFKVDYQVNCAVDDCLNGVDCYLKFVQTLN
ncbi:S41 family peptidase, partial [Draconibacterium sp.]|nr:S41 family peptidase [Draconibacterium sp.]